MALQHANVSGLGVSAPDVIDDAPRVPNRALCLRAPLDDTGDREARRFFRAIKQQSGGP